MKTNLLHRLLFLFLGMMSLSITAQVGIGTTTPRGALDINKTTTYNMGLVLPTNVSPANLINPQGGPIAEGTMMYDSAQKCVRFFNGTAWSNCLCDQCSGPTDPTLVANCTQNGFEGSYRNGVAVSGGKFTVTLTNNSFATATLAFQASDLVLSGVSGVTVGTVSPSSTTLNAGQSQMITYNITGTPASTGTLSGTWTKLSLTCSNTVEIQNGLVNSVNCNTGALTGSIIDGEAAAGVSKVINYNATGNYIYPAMNIASTGATGLTMSIPAGTLTNGNGSLNFTITGQTDAIGRNEPLIATFTVNLGGQICSFDIPIGILAKCGPTDTTPVIEITSPTGKVWMDRNLGARRAAISSTDHGSYGCLYQAGRLSDGHSSMRWNSSTSGALLNGTTTTRSTGDVPGNDLFIITSSNDWRTTANLNLWQGVNGINNPCPASFRLPTQAELAAEASANGITSADTAFSSVLKLSKTGRLANDNTQNYIGVGVVNINASSTFDTSDRQLVLEGGSAVGANNYFRKRGIAVRCIKN